jgi:hypothetical protein
LIFWIANAAIKTDVEEIMAEQNPAPEWLTGVWTRKALWFKGVEPDYSTRVFYIQTPTLFGDIRIPESRPDLSNASCLEDLHDTELEELVTQEGFAGYVETADNVVAWQREIDFQPPTGIPDTGQCTVDKNYMIETGIHSDYSEKWQRIDDGDGQFLAMQTEEDEGGVANQILVVAGDHFLYARGRKHSLEPAKSLTHLFQIKDFTREQMIRYLDCEFSYGRLRSGRKPWEIYLSTLPFKEGQSLITPGEMEVLPDLGVVYQHSRNLSSTLKRHWHISVSTLAISDMIALLSVD